MYIIASSDFFVLSEGRDSAVELIDLSPIRGTRMYYVHYCTRVIFFVVSEGQPSAVELISLFESYPRDDDCT